MAKDDPDVWFEPKRYGLGAGWPVAPQGWALLIGYLAAIFTLTPMLADRHPVTYAVVALILTGAFIAVMAQHTRGGLRWRWGGEDDR